MHILPLLPRFFENDMVSIHENNFYQSSMTGSIRQGSQQHYSPRGFCKNAAILLLSNWRTLNRLTMWVKTRL